MSCDGRGNFRCSGMGSAAEEEEWVIGSQSLSLSKISLTSWDVMLVEVMVRKKGLAGSSDLKKFV